MYEKPHQGETLDEGEHVVGDGTECGILGDVGCDDFEEHLLEIGAGSFAVFVFVMVFFEMGDIVSITHFYI